MTSTYTTVSPASILCMCVSLLLCVGIPVALAVWGKAKYKKAFSFLPLLGGALGFFISQILFRLPLAQAVLPQFGWYKQFMLMMQWPYLVFMCFTAGLVEEPGRFIVFSIMKKRRGFPDGLSYGIGHGGTEAILLIGLSFISNIIAATMINNGSASALGPLFPAAVIAELTGTAPYFFLAGGVERIFTVLLHIALSLVVLRGFQTGRKALYLFISFLLHGSANLAAIAMGILGTSAMPGSPLLGNVLFSEGTLLVIAVLSALYIANQAKAWRRPELPPEEPSAA
jgi:uncharacterized membrane protein YhfC